MFCFAAGWNIDAKIGAKGCRRDFTTREIKKKKISRCVCRIFLPSPLFLFIAAVSRLSKSAAILARAYFRRARKSEGRRVLKTRGEDEGGEGGGERLPGREGSKGRKGRERKKRFSFSLVAKLVKNSLRCVYLSRPRAQKVTSNFEFVNAIRINLPEKAGDITLMKVRPDTFQIHASPLHLSLNM